MPINIGDKSVSRIYEGDNEILRAYEGENLIYEAPAPTGRWQRDRDREVAFASTFTQIGDATQSIPETVRPRGIYWLDPHWWVLYSYHMDNSNQHYVLLGRANADGSVNLRYDVSGASSFGGRNSFTDDDLVNHLAFDGTNFYYLDLQNDKIQAYNKDTGKLDSSKVFDVPAGNRAIWADSTTLWIGGNRRMDAYTLATKARDTSKDLVLRSNRPAIGAAYNDGINWYFANSRGVVTSYNVATGARNQAGEFNTQYRPALDIYKRGRVLYITRNLSNIARTYRVQ